MNKAAELSCKSIAFPLIATGVYGFPKDEALQIALAEINKFLLTHDMKVILVVFDRKAFELSGKSSVKLKNTLMSTVRESFERKSTAGITVMSAGCAGRVIWSHR